MSLIDDIIKNQVRRSTQVKGKDIYEMGYVKSSNNKIVASDYPFDFMVSSETSHKKKYLVYIQLNTLEYHHPTCTCPQNEVETYCKHVAACLYYIKDNIIIQNESKIKDEFNSTLIQNYAKEIPGRKGSQKVIQVGPLFNEINFYYNNLTIRELNNLRKYLVKDQYSILDWQKEKNEVTFSLGKHVIKFEIKEHHFEAECSCKYQERDLCEHVKAIIMQGTQDSNNPYFLGTFRNIDDKIDQILASKGYDPEDLEARKLFDFYFVGADLFSKPTKGLIEELGQSPEIKALGNLKKVAKTNSNLDLTLKYDDYIIVFQPNESWSPLGLSVELYPILGTGSNPDKIKPKVKFKNKVEADRFPSVGGIFAYEWSIPGMILAVKQIEKTEPSLKFLPGEIIYKLDPEKSAFLDEHLLKFSEDVLDVLRDTTSLYFYPESSKVTKIDSLIKLEVSQERVKVKIVVLQQKYFISAKPVLYTSKGIIPSDECHSIRNIIFIHQNNFYLIDDLESKYLLESFNKESELKIHNSKKNEFIIKYLLPLQKKYTIDIPDELLPKYVSCEKIEKAVRLNELEPNFLLIEPIMIYDDHFINLLGDNTQEFDYAASAVLKREHTLENDFLTLLKSLHPDFASQEGRDFYYLPIQKVTKNHWFLDFLKTLEENQVEVFGQRDLRKLQYSVYRPKINITGSSKLDWFDLSVELTFGDEVVPLKVLKSALLNKQDYVTLSNGSLGVLPKEWISRLSSMLKLGKTTGTQVKLSKIHFGLLDATEDFLGDENLKKEIQEKKQKLLNIDISDHVPLPKNINAELRPYQVSGFQWFMSLYKLGWGGCLADDMGLGKTLQSLSFIQHVHNEKPTAKSLIICPTSLIYNWLTESKKFTPDLKTATFHGIARELPTDFDVLITSYGTYRNDLEQMKDLEFDICILDESQAIKNPLSNISKAVCEVKSQYRFVLSGTPLQNNTFDLYAQFNFINPGLLGSQEYFREEFSTPIDKHASTEKSQLLRKMIYPFMLRRTKDQVAKDLPDKTESIIYCDMDTYQRTVYDSLKKEYRDKILGKITSDGIEKTAFLILEGLNKLRMACDCPSLVKEGSEHPFKQESIKLKEVIREIQENSGPHKFLIFSQFLGMLDLIKNELNQIGIKHLYLDGSTPAKDRQGLVDTFQTDPDVKAFLISIKAGGVGLNLTAADYVYIVDPWWNPAVEDQAIDRTHRIGQQNKIFAYKLICQDTIEEKIQLLQQKKKDLAKEIIMEEASFIKKLTKDDIAWLLE